MDYGYLGDPAGTGVDDQKTSPILVAKCRRDRWISADVYPTKGVQTAWCVKRLAEELAAIP